MDRVILVRLYSTKPVKPSDFTGYLQNLTIQAFDLSFANPSAGDPNSATPGAPIGTASGLWTPNASYPATHIGTDLPATNSGPPASITVPDLNATGILQHFHIGPASGNQCPIELRSVATAVIKITEPNPEYVTSDIRLVFASQGHSFIGPNLDF